MIRRMVIYANYEQVTPPFENMFTINDFFYFFLFFLFPFTLQSSFSSPSLDFLLQQQQHQQEELINQQQQSLHNLESSFSDILFSQGQQGRAFIEHQTAQHSNSSSDTLVGIEEEQSSDLLLPTITHFKEEPAFSTNPHTPTNPRSVEQEHDLIFETSSTEELGLLSLRSSSDPTLSNTVARQPHEESVNLQRPQTSIDNDPNNPILPSFQETYPIKYNQLADFGLKMDEDCFNVGGGHSGNVAASYQHQHAQHSTPYGFATHSEYLQNVGNFYQHHYDSHSMVSETLFCFTS
jgi:nuclear receptor subfamily 4 group A member 2